MLADPFLNNGSHGHAGVKAGVGVLEDQLHLPAEGEHLGLVQGNALLAVEQGLAVVIDLAAGGLEQIQNTAARGGLAGTGLAHQAKALAGIDGEADSVHRFDHTAVFLGEGALSQGKVLLQIAYFNQRFRHVRSPPSSARYGPARSHAAPALPAGSAPPPWGSGVQRDSP